MRARTSACGCAFLKSCLVYELKENYLTIRQEIKEGLNVGETGAAGTKRNLTIRIFSLIVRPTYRFGNSNRSHEFILNSLRT